MKTIAPVILVIAMVVLSISCQEDMKEAVPKITSVRYTAPDSIAPITSVPMGAVIAIQGTGLEDVVKVKFNTVEQALNPNYVTSTNIIVPVPGDFPSEITNQICLYTASDKEYCFDFDIEVPGPSIEDVQYKITGSDTPDIITLIGYAFAEVTSLTIGSPAQIAGGTGTEILEYQINQGSNQLSFNVPVSFTFDQTDIQLICVAGSDAASIDWESKLKPAAYRISNEYAKVGDTTSIIGKNLASVVSVSFSGVDVTDFWESESFESLYFIVPEGVTPGQTTVSATNTFGEVSYTFRYAETDQMLIDFDDSIVCWDDPKKYDSLVINNDTNRWGYFRGDIEPSWWDQKRVYARCDESYSIFSTVANPMTSLAIMFEINVKNPWSGGGFFEMSFNQYVNKADGTEGDDIIIKTLWAPEYSDENPYTTDGWLTVSVPLSDFEIIADYSSQFDVTQLKFFWLRFFHDGSQTSSLMDMNVLVDNLRLSVIE